MKILVAVHGVCDDEDVVAKVINFWGLIAIAETIFDGKWVKVKQPAEDG